MQPAANVKHAPDDGGAGAPGHGPLLPEEAARDKRERDQDLESPEHDLEPVAPLREGRPIDRRVFHGGNRWELLESAPLGHTRHHPVHRLLGHLEEGAPAHASRPHARRSTRGLHGRDRRAVLGQVSHLPRQAPGREWGWIRRPHSSACPQRPPGTWFLLESTSTTCGTFSLLLVQAAREARGARMTATEAQRRFAREVGHRGASAQGWQLAKPQERG
mmetsp:Transcript_33064/g.105346  ORF Transcript_33064/g.105346 Transcript_33064/m.105346 type:complete len:218 (-) Transcript_33064:155-808(-)